MSFAKRFRVAAYAVAGLAFMAANAHADFITVYGWVTQEALINGSGTGATTTTLANSGCHMGTSACTFANADVKYTTTGVNYSSSANTIASWLASSVFPVDGLTETVAGSTALDPTIWEFVGNISVTSPDAFTIQHDDGVTFVVNGQTVVNAPGPTGAVPTPGTYTGAAGGSVPFSLIYDECCSPPAVLSVSLLGPSSAPVPEPTSIVLFGTVLLGVVTAIRRRKLVA